MHREALSDDELAVLSTPTHGPRAPLPTAHRDADGGNVAHPSLQELHRQFAGSLAVIFSGFANRDIIVRLRDQSNATYSQFVFGQSIPTCCAVIRAEPINLEFYLAVQPTICYPLIDRLLGCRQSDPIPKRPLSEIETGLMLFMMNEIVTKYGDAWQQALSLELQVDRMEHNVQQLGALAGSEQTYRARYGIRSGTDFGQLEVCLPWQATHQIRQRLAASQ